MPQENLNIALLQANLHWHDKTANLAMFEEKIWALPKITDLIVLPEMFNTGFSMEAEALAEPMNLSAHKWMMQMAKQSGAVITGSFIVKEGYGFFNRMLWAEPNGSFDFYDKRHLFRMAGEDEHYTAGTKRVVKELKGWKVFLQVCYDLRFPVWSRNRNNEYDLALYVANWPERRSDPWRALLKARAIENLAFVAGVNRVGEDGKGISYSGDTSLFAPDGKELYHKAFDEDAATLTLEAETINAFREKFPAYLDADAFELKPEQ